MNNLTLYCPKCATELTSIDNTPYKHFCKTCGYTLKDENTIDISFKSFGIAKALSNLCNYPFSFDGVHCASMESFIQSLKVKNEAVQRDVCSKTGPFCYSIRTMFDDWRINQTVFWQGKEIHRQSDEYITLLKSAYRALYNESAIFRYALLKSKGYNLIHSIGCKDKTETLLTAEEFIDLMNYIRELE